MENDEKMLEELKKIRMLLEPKPAAPTPLPPKGVWPEFKDFIGKYKIMGLAIAFIIGVYLGLLIQSLVKDLLLPAIGLVIPGLSDLATYAVVAMNQSFGVGNFLVALITFVIVTFVAFLLGNISKRWRMD